MQSKACLLALQFSSSMPRKASEQRRHRRALQRTIGCVNRRLSNSSIDFFVLFSHLRRLAYRLLAILIVYPPELLSIPRWRWLMCRISNWLSWVDSSGGAAVSCVLSSKKKIPSRHVAHFLSSGTKPTHTNSTSSHWARSIPYLHPYRDDHRNISNPNFCVP